MSNYFLKLRRFIIRERFIIISIGFLCAMISLGTARLILRNNFDIINLIMIISKSFCASLALLFILVSLLIRGKFQADKDSNLTRSENIVVEIWWALLNFFAIYFFIDKTLSGDFHFKLTDDMAKIVISIITALLISLLAEIKSKKN